MLLQPQLAAMSADQYLRGVRAVILKPGLGKGRTRILCKQLERRGGSVEPSVCTSTSHLLVGGKVRRSRLPVLLGVVEVPAGVWVVRGDWLSACLIRGERLREEEYEVPKETLSKTPPTSDSDYVDSGEEGEEEGERQLADVDISAVAPLAKRKVCSQTPPTLCLRLFILYCYSPCGHFLSHCRVSDR